MWSGPGEYFYKAPLWELPVVSLLSKAFTNDRNPLQKAFKKDRNPLKQGLKKDRIPLNKPFKRIGRWNMPPFYLLVRSLSSLPWILGEPIFCHTGGKTGVR